MRSERELLEECNTIFGGDLEILLKQLEVKVSQHLEANNLLTAKYYLADIKTVNNILVRREIR